MFTRFFFLIFLLANIGLFVYNRENKPEITTFQATDTGVNKLVLLSELEQYSLKQEPDNLNQANDFSSIEQVCFSIGAFDTKAAMQTTFDKLKNAVIKIRSREVVSSQEAGYWVYIPAMQTRDEALSVARQLSEAQVKDYYVVTTGEHENTLSLGVYRDSDNASSRVIEIRSKGFQVEKKVRIEQWPEFWLDYSIQQESLLDFENQVLVNIEQTANQVECNW